MIAVTPEDPFSGTVYYTIRGGICIVQVWSINCASGTLIDAVLAKNLPPSAACTGAIIEGIPGSPADGAFIFIDVNANFIRCHKAENSHNLYGSFCYPVKF